MTSLDRLAQMDGWDIGDDDAEVESVGSSVPAAAGQRYTLDDGSSKLVGKARKENVSERRQIDPESNQVDITRSVSAPLGISARWPSDGSDKPSPGRNQATITTKETSCGNGDTNDDQLLNTYPACRRGEPAGRKSVTLNPEKSFKQNARQAWGISKMHPLCTLRKRSFVSDSGSTSEGGITGGGTCTADQSAVIASMRGALRRAQEECAWERERREISEDQAKKALVALEAESKRAAELDSCVRLAEMRISLSSIEKDGRQGGKEQEKGGASEDGGGASGSVSSKISRWGKSSSSNSPREDGRQTPNDAEVAERQAQMTVLADAADAASREAQSALDTVEGFAALNRKLVDELRDAVGACDDLLERLSVERNLRVQLEEDIGQLLGGGSIAEFQQKERALKDCCQKAQEETARVVTAHARMDEEYRTSLNSSGRERARLEEAVACLGQTLLDERRAQEIRVREEAERAAMGCEEVLSIRAGLSPRTKRRGKNREKVPQQFGGKTAKHGRNGGGDVGGSKRLCGGGIQERKKAKKKVTNRVRIVPRPESAGHNGSGPQKQSGGWQSKRSSPGAVGSAGGGRPVDNHSAASRASGGGGGGSSIGVGGTGQGDGRVETAVYTAAVESVEAFLGDFVPKVEVRSPLSINSGDRVEKEGGEAGKTGGCGDGGGSGGGGSPAVAKKVSKWAAIGRGGKMSPRAAAVCLEEATKAAETAAAHRLRSVTDACARALSAAWLSLLEGVPAGASAHGGHSSSHDATVPTIAVRRLVQKCGILQDNPRGPTLAHTDMELQRHAVGTRGRYVGHCEFFKVIFALSRFRFVGEPKDNALDKLSSMLGPTRIGPGTPPTAHKQQLHEATVAARPAPIIDIPATAILSRATAVRHGLADAKRVLGRDRRALEAIFSYYSANYGCGPGSRGNPERQLLPFAALLSFCEDFELIPGLISHGDAHRIYVQLVYPNETQLTQKLLQAREGPKDNRAAGAAAGAGQKESEQEGTPAAGFGLGLGQWFAWLVLVAVGCTWFDKQRGLYDSPSKKVLGLLQWMEGSVGKKRISSKQGTTAVPAFSLLPPQATPTQR